MTTRLLQAVGIRRERLGYIARGVVAAMSLLGAVDILAQLPRVFDALPGAVLWPEERPRYIDRLFLESSSYLRQHAHNPLNWYLWGEEAVPFLSVFAGHFVPNRILAVVAQAAVEPLAERIPLVDSKTGRSGQVTAHVCENKICDLPTTDPPVFANQFATVHQFPVVEP